MSNLSEILASLDKIEAWEEDRTADIFATLDFIKSQVEDLKDSVQETTND